VFDKLDQTPDRELIRDWQTGVVTFEGRGRHQTNPAQPFKGNDKVGRNDPCPCGSGKKFKKCCGH
jgi:preprotein translocase subunit SecA